MNFSDNEKGYQEKALTRHSILQYHTGTITDKVHFFLVFTKETLKCQIHLKGNFKNDLRAHWRHGHENFFQVYI